MSAVCTYEVTIHGRGGHGSMPSTTVDPVATAAFAITRLQTIVSRETPTTIRSWSRSPWCVPG